MNVKEERIIIIITTTKSFKSNNTAIEIQKEREREITKKKTFTIW